MIFIGIIVFVVSSWAIFSRRLRDGIIAKHLFTFAAIAAALAVLDPVNLDAGIAAVLLLSAAFLYLAIKHSHHKNGFFQ